MVPPAEIAELWQKHSAGLLLLVRARFGNQVDCDAEDILQESFARLARLKRPPEDALAWLMRTSRNLAIDLLRSGKRRRHREHVVAEGRGCWFQSSPIQSLVAAEVAEGLQQLEPELREVLIAHLWNGMSFRQIANALDTSSSGIHRQYHLALEQLREYMDAR
ncbi:MAG: RNA polymerase sigma factor, partial [Planctomycetota bacterium]